MGRADGFDILIIGAGSAGCVLASRLSENASCRVGLVEAGGTATDPDIADPLKWPDLQGRAFDWAYRTVPQPHTAGRVHDWPRGRVVGGSSCLHAMAHVRGHPRDFDTWAEAGGARWSYAGLKPYFDMAEARRQVGGWQVGGTGPLDVYLPGEEINPVTAAYMAAGNALGVPAIGDHNGPELIGTAPNSLTIRDGRRISAADAYLSEPVLARPNLTLITGSDVEALIHDGSRATGVALAGGGETRRVFADRIILAAGAIGSPLLLMRSGIGDPGVLKAVGIPCRIDHPSVGANLQDHMLLFGNVYRTKQPVPPSKLQHSESLMYLNSADLTATTGRPDIVLGCVAAPLALAGFDTPAFGEAFTLLCGVTHPTSRGTIRPTGPASTDPPLIDPRYLECEQDRRTFLAALKTARLVAAQPPLDPWRDREVLPGPDTASDDDLAGFIARAASTHHHPCGTCRMGRDADAVVDPDLKLVGLDNVHVVDASILPTLPSGPIHAAVIAVAEAWCGEVAGAV